MARTRGSRPRSRLKRRKGTLFGKPIGQVVKRPGAFTAKAKAAGRGVQAHARHVLANKDRYDARTVRQAALARTFKKMARRRKKRRT